MNLHISSKPEPSACWAISPLQQSLLRAMHLIITGRALPGRTLAHGQA
ncbi:hypothetical protein [Erythrobacter tepidarius]|nr:hypothetical protein [Erythrobacter tepidarius]